MNSQIRWTEEEIEFAAKNIFKLSNEELESKLGRTMNAITKKLQMITKNGKIADYNRAYTKIEDEIILDNHGTVSMEKLQMMVFRTEHSIRSRLYRLHGEAKVNSFSGKLTTRDISEILGYSMVYVRRLYKKTDIPFEIIDDRLVIEQDLFWQWIKVNNTYMNPGNIDNENLYYAPEWYVKLVNDRKKELNQNTIKSGKWSMFEISTAKHLKSKGYTLQEIADELHRNWRSVKEMFARMRKLENSL